MSIVASTIKVALGLAAFASLMTLEFASYTRAVAQEVRSPVVLESQKVSQQVLAAPVKKESKALR